MICISQISRQKSEVIRESLSVTILLGVPKRHSTFSKNNCAKSAAVVSSCVGKNRAYFVTRQTTVSMLSYACPLRVETGSPVIQSKLISLKGAFHKSVGIGSGSS